MKKLLLFVMTTAILITCFSACGKTTTEEDPTPTEQETDTEKTDENDLISSKGNVKLAGSTSMEDLVKLITETMPETYTGITLQGEFVGSSAGIEQLLAGNCDIGNASRELKDEEKENGAVENVVAYDGISIIKNPSNGVEDISKEDLLKVYKGEIKNWNELGGEDVAIVVIGRESGSGTRGAYEELLNLEEKCELAQELDSNGSVITAVSGTEGAIGYASLNIADANSDKVSKLTLDGIECSEETIKSGEYSLFRPFVMATKGEISEQSEPVQAVFEYLKSEQGMSDIELLGLFTTD